jgi:hypothetical protein
MHCLLLLLLLPVLSPQLQGMLSPFGELKDCVVIVEKMSQKSKVRDCKTSYVVLAEKGSERARLSKTS